MINTGYKDHTGRMIREGDRCAKDSGHAHCDDWLGSIRKLKDGTFEFVEDHERPGMGCRLEDCNHLLEVVK